MPPSHRRGTLVGPDLASVGLKYGGKELLYHIQYPSGAINYSFTAITFLLEDGRVLNGLVINRDEGQITLGIATGQQITFSADEVEEERPQTVSLMPKGLVANLTQQELADLIEFLLNLRQGDAGRLQKSPSTGQSSVKPGINDRFLDPQLDVSEWIGRFEIESREVYAARERVLSICAIKPGDTVADIGAGTGFYSRLFSAAVGEQGSVYAVDVSPKFWTTSTSSLKRIS